MNEPTLTQRLFIALQYCLPQHAVSRLVGFLAESEIPWLKNFLIKTFARFFPINIAEAVPADFEKYPSFNAFFTRPLKADARPIDADETSIVSPADGAISEIGIIQNDRLLQAKGQQYSLLKLLGGDVDLAAQFRYGSFATIYLSPSDYHRVHMPFAGELQKSIYVPGELFSVNQTTAEHVPELFARNERLICVFDTRVGPMVVILVGAVIVAGIETVWAGQVAPPSKTPTAVNLHQSVSLGKGEEMGRFKLGSTAIVLFPNNLVIWNKMLANGSQIRLGESLGKLK